MSEVPTIPGEAGVRRVTLCAPGLVGCDTLPSRVVVRRSSPAYVISKAELPFAIDGHRATANMLNGKSGHDVDPFGWLQGFDNDRAVAQQQRE